MATTKKQKRQEESIEKIATLYRDGMLALKELEKQLAPYKKTLLDHAKTLGVESVEIGSITLEKRTTVKGDISPELVTPDWLYRMRRDGYDKILKIGIDSKAVKAETPNETFSGYLAEVGYTEKESVTYAIRI